MTDYGALATEMNQQQNSSSSSSSDDSDYDTDSPIVNVVPTSAIEFDEIVDIGLMGGITDEQNIRNSGRDSNDAVITISGPSVGEGTLYKATNGHSADYKLVNEDYDKVDVDYNSDGEAVGIRTYGRKFESEKVDDFEEDTIRLMIGSAAGLRLLQLLDCRGSKAAYVDEDGNKVDGLIEYPPNYNSDDYNPSAEDNYQRVAIGPVLRSDMEGQEGVLHFFLSDEKYGDNYQHRVGVYNSVEPTVDDALEPTDEGERDSEYDPFLHWAEEFDSDDGNDGGDDVADDSSGDDDLSMDFEEEGTTYSELSDPTRSFVDKVVEKEKNGEVALENFDTARMMDKVAADNDTDMPEDPADVEAIIDSRT